MKNINHLSPGFEFPETVIQVSEEEQRHKLSCCDIDGLFMAMKLISLCSVCRRLNY